ncbi:MAG: AAA domain-containing protein [archaeon]
MEDVSINSAKYFQIASEIEGFVEAKKKKQITIDGTVEKIDLNEGLLIVKLRPTKQIDLSIGSQILIREDSVLGTEIRGIVREYYNLILKIEIKRNPSQFEKKKVIIDINKTTVILDRLKPIIENLRKGNVSSDNVKILDFMLGENRPQYCKKSVSFISKRLNENQKDAVRKSIEADDFHLIIGPPGTGKTYVIEELIRQFSKRNQKILITAWTNLAVDNIIKRLMNRELEKIVRIGPIEEIDAEVKEYSIFEKMKKHKDWKEVERLQDIINSIFCNLPKKRDEIDSAQEEINKLNEKKKTLDKKRIGLLSEKQKYLDLISKSTITTDSQDISSTFNAITELTKKSEFCSTLSKNILQMNELETKIPDKKEIQKLKIQTRDMKISILGIKIKSFFYKFDNVEIEKLKIKYKKNRDYLDEISVLQKRSKQLRKICIGEFYKMYPDGNGFPDRDALNFEFRIYNVLKEHYLPTLKEQEASKIKMKDFELTNEVYIIYEGFLETKIDLYDSKIKSINTELFIQINHKNDLSGEYQNLSSSLDYHKRTVEKLKKAIISEIINDADIIAATAISSCHYFLDDIDFDVMIMDEASQVASFMSLLPILKCKKIILVGDNRQLQPIEEEDISKEMNLSIFNRFFELYPYAATLLTIQYRMHEIIAQIASEIFYEGKLRTSESVNERILRLNVCSNQFLSPMMPVLFIDTSKRGYYEDEIGSGCSNSKEAMYVADIVSLFINEVNAEDIGVITPYVKQKLLIKKYLNDIKINNVEVDTVHKYQGREKDIIILSFARSKRYSFPEYKLKFIENECLVNVAITRARNKLILVGDYKTLYRGYLLRKVIDKIGKENTILL